MKRLILLLVMVIPLSASAEIYSWTDAAGTIHFTEDLGAVPKQYRTKLTVRDDTLQPGSPEYQPAAADQKPAAVSATSPAGGAVVAPQGAAAAGSDNGLYAGKSGAAWQAEFRQSRGRLQALDEQLKQLQAEMKNPREIITPAKVAELNQRRGTLSGQYEAAAADLNRLVERANQAGLPTEFSQ